MDKGNFMGEGGVNSKPPRLSIEKLGG